MDLKALKNKLAEKLMPAMRENSLPALREAYNGYVIQAQESGQPFLPFGEWVKSGQGMQQGTPQRRTNPMFAPDDPTGQQFFFKR